MTTSPTAAGPHESRQAYEAQPAPHQVETVAPVVCSARDTSLPLLCHQTTQSSFTCYHYHGCHARTTLSVMKVYPSASSMTVFFLRDTLTSRPTCPAHRRRDESPETNYTTKGSRRKIHRTARRSLRPVQRVVGRPEVSRVVDAYPSLPAPFKSMPLHFLADLANSLDT